MILWFYRCIEALARAGVYDKPLLHKAVAMFEVFISYTFTPLICTDTTSGFPHVSQSRRALYWRNIWRRRRVSSGAYTSWGLVLMQSAKAWKCRAGIYVSRCLCSRLGLFWRYPSQSCYAYLGCLQSLQNLGLQMKWRRRVSSQRKSFTYCKYKCGLYCLCKKSCESEI